MKRLRKQRDTLRIDGAEIPIDIYYENRKTVRASLGRKSAILRIPIFVDSGQAAQHIHLIKDWLKNKVAEKPELLLRFQIKQYADGDALQVGSRSYLLRIQKTNHKSHRARLSENTIFLALSNQEEGVNLQNNVKKLLSRVVGHDFLPEITEKVHAINNQYFRKKIKSVKLRYSHTRWGSCSSTGNINLSTRLLFAPDDIVRYVIVHEITHMIEFNHSKKFWNIIGKVMPDFKEKETWLKEKGHQCDF